MGLTFISFVFINNELSKNRRYHFYNHAKNIAAPIRKVLSEDDFLRDEANTRTLVINLWATWCPPCQKEIPELNQLVDKYENENILFLSISNEKEKDVSDWIDLQKNEPEYFQLYEQQRLTNYLFTLNPSKTIKKGRYPERLPTNLIINDNKLVYFKQGFSRENIAQMDSVLQTISLQNQTTSCLPGNLPDDRQ